MRAAPIRLIRFARRMNLYLLLAIALGAISGTTEAPVARTRVAERGGGVRGHHQRAGDRVAAQRQHHARFESTTPRVIDEAPARIEAPLAGAATPRAPATNC